MIISAKADASGKAEASGLLTGTRVAWLLGPQHSYSTRIGYISMVAGNILSSTPF